MDTFTLEILHVTDQEATGATLQDIPRLSAVLNALRSQDVGNDGIADNTLTLSSGDAFIPGLFFDASEAVFGAGGIADIEIQNQLGFQALALGNHEFDFDTRVLSELITGQDVTDDSDEEDGIVDTVPEAIGEILGADFDGTDFPYLSVNLDFALDPFLAPLVVEGGQAPQGNVVSSSTVLTVENEGGNGPEVIGIVGATTPTLASISSPGTVGISPGGFDADPTPEQIDELAAIIQAEVDALLAANPDMDKVILLAHMQQISVEFELAERLENVDVIIAGGSNTRQFDENDRIRDGDVSQGTYPEFIENAGGTTTAVINTDGSYQYVGRLVIDFDADGNIIAESYDAEVSGAYATDDQGVADLNAQGLVDPEVQDIVDAIEAQIIETESNVFGLSTEFLNGNRSGDEDDPADTDGVRTQETNLGNLTADANLAYAQETDETVLVSIKNGGGIRASIGEVIVPPGGTGDPTRSPNSEITDGDGELVRPEGGISQNDIQSVLAFNNGLTLLTLTREELVGLLEHGVAALPEVSGRFPQVAGLEFSFDSDLPEGERIQNAAIVDEDGAVIAELVRDGELAGDANEGFRVVTLDFLAEARFDDTGAFIGGGDGYPFPNLNTDPTVGEVGDPDVIARVNAVALVQEDVQTGDATFADDGTEQDALAEYLDDNFSEEAFAEADTGRDEDGRIQNLDFRDDAVFDDANDGTDAPPAGEDGDDDGEDVADGEGDGDNGVTGGGGDMADGGDDAGDGDDSVDGGEDVADALFDFTLIGTEGDDDLHGTGCPDAIFGDDGNDTIDGGYGADTIDGGLGADELTGGCGPDTFVFSTALGGGNVDLITDFEMGYDRIALSSDIFSEAGAAGPLSCAAFAWDSCAVNSETRIIYDRDTGALSYDADGTGEEAAIQFAQLDSGLCLSAATFEIM